MSEFNQSSVRNLLLKSLPEEAFELILPHMQAVELPTKHSVVVADTPTKAVCFLESGLASVVATSLDGEDIEVGHIGKEGMAGLHVLHRIDRTPNKTFMQVAGEGITVPVSVLLSALEVVPAANVLMLSYVHCTEIQLAQSALANGRYLMHERLARWLLMCHDRLNGDDLPLTHEFLSLMLGVRRSGVTTELHIIEGMLAIKATRGNIQVRSRKRLEEIARGCYGIPEREYERLIGLAIRRS